MTSDRINEITEVYAPPCPFCGGTDIRTLRTPTDRWATICYPFTTGCGARTDYQFTSQAANYAWSRRTPSTT